MPSYRDTDIQPMLDEFGIPVTIGGVTARCIVYDSDEEIAAQANSVLVGRSVILRTKPGTFAAAAQGAAAVVDYPTAGTAYKVVAVRRVSDQHTSIICARL